MTRHHSQLLRRSATSTLGDLSLASLTLRLGSTTFHDTSAAEGPKVTKESGQADIGSETHAVGLHAAGRRSETFTTLLRVAPKIAMANRHKQGEVGPQTHTGLANTATKEWQIPKHSNTDVV